jgi:N-acetyl-anhydromuramyl-L-alanine amidase AmpD
MSYSKLVSYVKLSPNCTKPRNKKTDKITIHYMAVDATIEGVGSWFAKKTAQASSNYGIGSDGRIACYVEEENRSWASSSPANDNRAITIEVANYPDGSISEKAWASLINLCVDICQRYNFKLNFTGDKNGNLTMHKWFAPTACPGPWLEPRFPQIAAEVNKRLGVDCEPVKSAENEKTEEGCIVKVEMLKKGSKGETVKALQILLIGNGFSCGICGADGDFGSATDRAVRRFQQEKAISVDGIVGSDTWSHLLGVK